MALKGKWGTYIHIPKCGGWGFRKFLRQHLGPGQEDGPFHGLPLEVTDGFCIVRHPVSWLRSIWAYRNNTDWRVNPNSVNYWPAIMGLTQWAAGLTWPDFVNALAEHQVDIVSCVYGMYRHHNVKYYHLENLQPLLDKLVISETPPVAHTTPNKPEVTPLQREKLEYVCHRSMVDYGYAQINDKNIIAEIASLRAILDNKEQIC